MYASIILYTSKMKLNDAPINKRKKKVFTQKPTYAHILLVKTKQLKKENILEGNN